MVAMDANSGTGALILPPHLCCFSKREIHGTLRSYDLQIAEKACESVTFWVEWSLISNSPFTLEFCDREAPSTSMQPRSEARP
jgi:hypothetical protein